MKQKTKNIFLLFLFSFLAIFATQNANAFDANELRARFIYQRLTSKVLRAGTPLYNQMVMLVTQGRLEEAARVATQDPSFIDATARLWAVNTLTKDGDPNMPLNDSVALMMGIAKDNLDIRQLLTGNFIYGRDPRMGRGRPRVDNNQVFQEMDIQGRDLGKVLYKYSPQWESGAPEVAGIFTTRWWASLNYSAGTNRRTIPNLMDSFMCQKIEQWKRPNLPTYRIRQDIDRFPSGNARVFQTECRTCHTIMDGLAGAFAKIDYENERIVWTSGVAPKYLAHADVYPDGYVTTDNSWVNFLTGSSSRDTYGWQTPTTGRGITEFAQMMSQSDLYTRCMAKRVFKAVCRKDLGIGSREITEIDSAFRQRGYATQDLFVLAAISDACAAE